MMVYRGARQLFPFVRLSLLAVLVVFIAWAANSLAEQAGGWVPHAVSHLTAGLIALLITLRAVILRRHRSVGMAWAGNLGPLVLIGGLALFTLSQLIESFSAVIEYPESGTIHDVTSQSTMLGLLVTFVGAAVIAYTAARVGRFTRWTLGLVILLGLFVMFSATCGLPSV